jgi:hypothetical protein
LLVAALFIVAAVIVFLVNMAEPAQASGSQKLYENLCIFIDSDTADCACYTQNSKDFFETTAEAETYCCTTQTDSFLKQKWGCS